ncbi:ATP-binding protein [Kitasatospora sp. NPDC004669]|uniref:ATP-binding protein n=1 Tax=Kitasatospora sp. NPDC004669 TaxID=3154555 RepID=UPI0033BCF491
MADLRLTHLTYAGSGKPTARVAFGPDLTVIYGASDTGKSFIVESIEYMLGGARLPLIPEADGYSQIFLGLQMPDGAPITLVRRPGAGTVAVHYEDLRDLVTRRSDRELTAVHRSGSSRSLCAILLAEPGYADAQIRKNDAGGTRGLSLADLVHLSLVTETRMGDPLSPVLRSNAASGKTAAASVMKYLLTGEDDPVVDT